MNEIAISGIGAVFPGASGSTELIGASFSGSVDGDWLDCTPWLSAKEVKYMPEAAKIAVAASGLALNNAQQEMTVAAPAAGVIVGTNFAASESIAKIDAVSRRDGVAAVRPIEAPYFSINLPGSHVSIKFGLRAFNLTLTNPAVAGLDSVITGFQQIALGRAPMVLAGATEGKADPCASEALGAAELAPGGCMLVLESASHLRDRGANAWALLRGAFSAFVPDDKCPYGLETKFAALLNDAPRLLPIAFIGHRGRASGVVRRLVTSLLESRSISYECYRGLGTSGQHATVSPLLALSVLALQFGDGLVVCTSPHGHLAALRIAAPCAATRRNSPVVAFN